MSSLRSLPGRSLKLLSSASSDTSCPLDSAFEQRPQLLKLIWFMSIEWILPALRLLVQAFAPEICSVII